MWQFIRYNDLYVWMPYNIQLRLIKSISSWNLKNKKNEQKALEKSKEGWTTRLAFSSFSLDVVPSNMSPNFSEHEGYAK